MDSTLLFSQTSEYLRQSLKWKDDPNLTTDRVYVTGFFNFLKLKLLADSPIAKRVLEEFMADSRNAKLEGKLELCVEMALEKHSDWRDELQDKIDKLRQVRDKHFSPKVSPVKEAVEALGKTVDSSAKDNKQVDVEISIAEVDRSDNHVMALYDFTPVGEFVLQHAVKLAQGLSKELILFHFANKGREQLIANKRLKELAAKTGKTHDLTCTPLLKTKTGDLFKTINEEVKENNVKLLVMGPKTLSGSSKDSNFIANTEMPVLYVQQAPPGNYQKAVFSVDSRKEIKHKVGFAIYFSKFFDIKYYVARPGRISIDAINTKTINNMKFIETFFSQAKLNYESLVLEKLRDSVETTLHCAKDTSSDMIIMLPDPRFGLSAFNIGSDERTILKNPQKLPVMCVNPKSEGIATFGRGIIY